MTQHATTSIDTTPHSDTVPGSRFSYASGISEKPLKGQTIGDCFDETVERYPERDA